MHKAIRTLKRDRLSLSVLAAILGDAVIAQEPLPPEEITVTGSRIRQVTGMATPTPVTAVTMTELTEMNPGSTTAEQLAELPQFFATPTAQRGGNAISTTAGGSYLNLRGMGLNRTLVLLDGTRIAPADANGSVNIDNFPTALLQRVDASPDADWARASGIAAPITGAPDGRTAGRSASIGRSSIHCVGASPNRATSASLISPRSS